MSTMTDKLKKSYPANVTVAIDLPTVAPEDHPIPWTHHSRNSQGLHVIRDADDVTVALVSFQSYDLEGVQAFVDRMNSINKTNTFQVSNYYQKRINP